MVDFINKLIKFPKINLVVRPTLCLYKTENSQILLCEDIKNKNKFCLKIILTQIDNTFQLSSINTEILLLQKLKQEENMDHFLVVLKKLLLLQLLLNISHQQQHKSLNRGENMNPFLLVQTKLLLLDLNMLIYNHQHKVIQR